MKIKKGQTVRLVIEGTVHQRGERLCVSGGNFGSTVIADLEGTPLFWTEKKGIELTILSELQEPQACCGCQIRVTVSGMR
jgi:hypothetical protein